MPATDAVHWLVALDWIVVGEQDAVTEVMVDPGGFTITVVDPDLLASWTEVALIVTVVDEETAGAVNKPDADTVPAVADHITALE